MYIERLSLVNFRIHERIDIELSPTLNFIVGKNGSGKTSVVEGLYFSLTGRSFRTKKLTNLIKFDAEFARAEVGLLPSSMRLATHLDRSNSKSFTIDGVGRDRSDTNDFRPKTVVFFPDRIELVSGSPITRRGHLDQLASALFPSHPTARTNYLKALSQRNSIISQGGLSQTNERLLTAWEKEMGNYGYELVTIRRKTLKVVSDHLPSVVGKLGLNYSIKVDYKPNLDAESPEQLTDSLCASRASDFARRFTTKGPHRDDFSIQKDGIDTRVYGSQGERRIALLALLVAEARVIEAETGGKPLLLLDDVTGELDTERSGALLNSVADVGQTVITATDVNSRFGSSGQILELDRVAE